MTTSAQLERQSDQQRAQIAETLDELRSRMTPGQIVDQVADYVRQGTGGTFVRNLRDQVMSNPVPVTLVGAGLAWMFLSGFRDSQNDSSGRHVSKFRSPLATSGTTGERISAASAEAGERARAVGEDVRQRASDLSDAAGEYAQGLKRSAAEYGDDARRAAHDFRDRLTESATAGYEKAAAGYENLTDAASSAYRAATESTRVAAESIGASAHDARTGVVSAGEGIARVLKEQPLVLAGLGLAVGALLGAVLPTAEIEDKVMGEASDSAKRKMGDLAREALDKGKAVVEGAWEGAREEAEDQGLLPLNEADAKREREFQKQASSEASLVPHDTDEQGVHAPGGA